MQAPPASGKLHEPPTPSTWPDASPVELQAGQGPGHRVWGGASAGGLPLTPAATLAQARTCRRWADAAVQAQVRGAHLQRRGGQGRSPGAGPCLTASSIARSERSHPGEIGHINLEPASFRRARRRVVGVFLMVALLGAAVEIVVRTVTPYAVAYATPRQAAFHSAKPLRLAQAPVHKMCDRYEFVDGQRVFIRFRVKRIHE